MKTADTNVQLAKVISPLNTQCEMNEKSLAVFSAFCLSCKTSNVNEAMRLWDMAAGMGLLK